MKRALLAAGLVLVFLRVARAEPQPEPYEVIKTKQVLYALIIRNANDRVCSGLIKSQPGLARFERAYGVKVTVTGIDFTKQMLIFGVTDNISSVAFQLLIQRNLGSFTLDYADTGVYKKFGGLEPAKRSVVQAFLLDRVDAISRVGVKNMVEGLSLIFDGP